MKILLVDNDSDTWKELQQVVHEVGHRVTPVHHAMIHTVKPEYYDVAILSGGWWYDNEVDLLNEYADELQFIMLAPIPILGICVGMQLMHVALNRDVPLMEEPQSGDRDIYLTEIGRHLTELPEKITVHKNHTRAIFETDPQFEILAKSKENFTEMMRHRKKPLLGVQFHPEIGKPGESKRMMKTLLDTLLKVEKS